MVIAEHLLIKVTKQMKWFDTHVGPADAALQQAPKVFESIGVNLSVNIFLGVVNNFVGVVLSQPVVRLQRVGVERRACLNVLSHAGLQSGFLTVGNYGSANLAATLQCSEHDGLVFAASTSDAPLAFVNVHVTGLAADEGFVNFDF